MPTRAFAQSVLQWPGVEQVRRALIRWAAEQHRQHPEMVRLGYFGSYARGDWGVGSDLDLVIVVTQCEEPFERRAASWPTETLPVPVDAVVYTQAEWDALQQQPTRFARVLREETAWVIEPEGSIRR